LGAEVAGYSLSPPTEPALFNQLGLASRLQHIIGDVRDLSALRAAIQHTEPDFIFHLAAQPIVRRSYFAPMDTYATNVMGTVHLLESLRHSNRPCAVLIATTDKCYQNNESGEPHSEGDALGGNDPYSSSKACAELAVAAYRKSYFSGNTTNVAVASARAGNVLGGGDWATERILPDCVRSLERGQTISLRNPNATRPWQHVLECLSGYLSLAAQLAEAQHEKNVDRLRTLASAFNFGPRPEAERTVKELVNAVLQYWPGEMGANEPSTLHEASRLNLSSEKAQKLLGWKPVWEFPKTIAETVGWYRRFSTKSTPPPVVAEYTRDQISRYMLDARELGLTWAQ
jgi:CDP-glucose 4,6-dehydratase